MRVRPVIRPRKADGRQCLHLLERVHQAVYVGSIDNGFASQLQVAMLEKLGKSEEGTWYEIMATVVIVFW